MQPLPIHTSHCPSNTDLHSGSQTRWDPADLLTPEQAAQMLGLSVKTLATWRSTGRHALPYIRCGARIRYQRVELDSWLAERRRTCTIMQGAE